MKGGWRYGAGRPARYRKAESVPSLDIRRLQRGGHLSCEQRLTWRWSSGAVVDVDAAPDAVVLHYRFKRGGEWQAVAQRIAIIRTPCHYGGSRPWFACPACGRRCAIVYLWGRPKCRTCGRLVYRSQSEDAIGRSWKRTERIMERLGQVQEGPHAIPRRPKGMRQATFDRLWRAWLREDERREEMMVAFLIRMKAGMD